MQSVSSRIWTRVAVSISYDDNHYTTGTLVHYTHGLVSHQARLCNSSATFSSSLSLRWAISYAWVIFLLLLRHFKFLFVSLQKGPVIHPRVPLYTFSILSTSYYSYSMRIMNLKLRDIYLLLIFLIRWTIFWLVLKRICFFQYT